MENGKKSLKIAVVLLGLFVLWTWLVQTVDVRPAGETAAAVGFATVNARFHRLTGVHMTLYTVTDWLGLVPVLVCGLFATVGAVQLWKRKSLRQVDPDLLLLGGYYALVILCYLGFEAVPVNYRPVWIEGRLEASYPSSTTLLVLSVMPTLVLQANRRVKRPLAKRAIAILSMVFSAAMVWGRLLSGVHWLTDILGSLLLSAGLFSLYRAGVLLWCDKTH